MPELTPEQMQTKILELEDQVNRLRDEIVNNQFSRNTLPKTNILSPNFLTRAFAIYGHTLVAGLIVGIIFYCIIFGIIIAIGGSIDSLFNNF
ncbi:MAG TPA: hypothetical protein VN226_07880 [Anaerolineales bacterium]|nr:hypothetical protein [Anaerolineales bacterium]